MDTDEFYDDDPDFDHDDEPDYDDADDCMNCGVCEWCIERSIETAREMNDMALPKRPPTIRTLRDLKAAFDKGTISTRYWTMCVDSGGIFLRYVGPNTEGMAPALPVVLDLSQDNSGLLVEACELAGIPAEQA